jgi:cell fate regulator YaaT (PSP1 superfamily)
MTSHDQYLVSFGKSGAVGVFTAPEPITLRRGSRAIVQTSRGIEIGTVLHPATLRQARLLGAVAAGTFIRPGTAEDLAKRQEQSRIEQTIFDASRAWASSAGLNLEILDVDLLFNSTQAILQFVGDDTDTEKLAQAIEQQFSLSIRLENIAGPRTPPEEEPRCDKPDCGREGSGGGGCSTCSTGGGCSSCGESKVDLREYFSHLRTKMSDRVPLN